MWRMISMNLSRRNLYDIRWINPGLRVFSGTSSRSSSNHSLFDITVREREVLQEQVAALKAKKVAWEAEKRDIMLEHVTTLKAEKVTLAAKKVEVVASLNKLLDDARFLSKEGDPKIYANDKAGSHFLRGPIDEGPDPDYDYSPLFSVGEEDLILSEKKDSEDDEPNEDQIPLSKYVKASIPSTGTDVGQSSGQVDA
ncbi:hypothetical protein ACOSQ3_012887 [Xanthoceras sorbifolium]